MDDDDDVERQAPHGDSGPVDQESKAKKGWWIVGITAIVIVGTIVAVVVPVMYTGVDTQYSVRVDSVSSGLDPTRGLSFNLTLTVASRSHGAKACINPGMSVEVFYRGVQVAVSDAETGQTCARPRNVAELPVMARATGVPVGNTLETLEADMTHGQAVFDIKLHVPAWSFGGIGAMASWMTDCKGTRVAGAVVVCESPDQS